MRIDDAFNSARVSATLVTHEEKGLVSYATGTLTRRASRDGIELFGELKQAFSDRFVKVGIGALPPETFIPPSLTTYLFNPKATDRLGLVVGSRTQNGVERRYWARLHLIDSAEGASTGFELERVGDVLLTARPPKGTQVPVVTISLGATPHDRL